MNKESAKQAPIEGSEKAGHSIRWYWAVSVVGFTLLLVCTWAVVYLQYQTRDAALTKQHLESTAEGVREELARINAFRMALLQTFSSDPALSALFNAGDTAALKQREDELQSIVPDVLRVRLLPVGIQEVDKSQIPHLGFASLKQLRVAEKTPGVLPAEVHQFATPQQHISLVAGVRENGDGPLTGLLHAAFPIDEFQAVLEHVKDFGGQVAIRQHAPNVEPFDLAQQGSRSSAQGAAEAVLPIAGSIWEVAYWTSAGNRFDLQTDLLLLLPGVALLVLMSLLLFLLVNMMGKALKRDQHSILSMVEALLVGRPPKQHMAQLADIQPTLDVLHHQIKEHRVSKREAKQGDVVSFPAAQQPSQGMEVVHEAAQAVVSPEDVELPASIFRAYDIRGVVGETLTPDMVYLLGQSIGSEIFEKGFQSVVVGRDGRHSSEGLHSALISGLQASGREVVDVGLVPTPLLYYATHELNGDCGVIVTGSHNPKEYNGLKIVVNGESPSPEAIQDLRRRIDAGQLLKGEGSFDSQEVIPEYIERIVSDVRLARPMKVVVDCGNGAAAVVAPQLYRELGCEVVELFCEVDGSFPNHHPDPGQPENMQALQQAVIDHQADLGLAFDGDADRLGVVDSSGKLIWPDRLLMYLAIDVLTREPGGDIVYDVKCTRHLANVVLSNGGRPLMWKSGHSMLKAKMKETHALLAGEFSGHIMFSERWYGFDDGLYAGARLLEILALDYRTSAEAFAELPDSLATPEYKLPLQEGRSKQLMENILSQPDLPGARILKIDGLRAEFEEGWGLVRASNTMPSLLFRFESDTETGLESVKSRFRDLMSQVDANLRMPF